MVALASPEFSTGETRPLVSVLLAIVLLPVVLSAQRVTTPPPAPAPAGTCVTIGVPSPSKMFTYELNANGSKSLYSQRWESLTSTQSLVHVTRLGRDLVERNTYKVVNDVAVMSRMTKGTATQVTESTTFSPGLVSDPIFRACEGKSWLIPAVTATYVGAQRASAQTPAGNLAIRSIHESVTVPAGTFDTVHYTRTSQSVDDYWKSIQHGVIVKHVSIVKGGAGGATELLIAIK